MQSIYGSLKGMTAGFTALAVFLVAAPEGRAQYVVKNVQPVQTVLVKGASRTYPPLPAGGSISYSGSVSVGRTFSTTLGLNATIVSTQIGFQVSENRTVTVTKTVNFPPKKYITLTPVVVYTRLYFEIWNAGRKVGTGTALRYEYDFVEGK